MRRLLLFVCVWVCAACAAAPTTPTAVTPIVPTATVVSANRSTPVPVSTAAFAGDLAPYRAAMKSEFAAEVDRFGDVPQYQIDLTIAPDHESYTATQQVRYTNQETVPLSEIYFRLFPNSDAYGGQLTIDSLQVEGAAVKPVYELDRTALRVDLEQPLQPGETIELELAYTVQVPTEEVELGYNRFGWHDDVLALPAFFPLIPAYDDEGWNVEVAPSYGDTVFSDTALFQVNITAPAEDVVAASGSCTTTPGEQTQTLRCVSGPMRDFMIAASPEFEVWSGDVEGVKINSYARKSLKDGGQKALQVAQQAVKSYNERFGPYPFAELDVVGTPTTAGGIEYPGLIVIAEGIYERAGLTTDMVVAHEVGHQWWYSLVGNDQIDEPWIDEALTQFATALYFRDWYGSPGMEDMVKDWLSVSQMIQETPFNKRADLPVADYTEDQYGAVVYEKAPLFFNGLYEALGDEKFNLMMQDYFQTYRYGVAYPKDFIAIAAKHAGQDKVDDLLKEWITTP